MSESGNDIVISASASSYYGADLKGSVEGDLDKPNTFTFAFNRADTANVTIDAYVNAALATSLTTYEKKNEDIVMIFEGADAYIYAIRVYNYSLSADEIAQNNFADIAKFNSLDIDGYLAADADAKAAVYAAFAGKTLDNIAPEAAQALLDATLNPAE